MAGDLSRDGPAGSGDDPPRLQHADPLRARSDAEPAKGGCEEGVESLAESAIIAPSGEIVSQTATDGDELIVATADLDWCNDYKNTLFDFDRYRRPEMYGRITSQKGVVT